jgi:transcriptional regulator with XRE-family HTH domain
LGDDRLREWLVKARQQANLSQKAVCNRIGISQPTYWEYEHGDSTPTPANAKKIGEILGFPWTRFYEDDNRKEGKAG